MSDRLVKLKSACRWPDARPNLAIDLGPAWFSEHPQFGHAFQLEKLIPKDFSGVLLELGSFMGRSTVWFAQHAPASHIICIDTWKGSPEHADNQELANIMPNLYDRFIANVWEFKDRVTPIVADTITGMTIVRELADVTPDIIYVDADHSEQAVYMDTIAAGDMWPNALIIGDDWTWPTVRAGAWRAAIELGKEVKFQGETNAPWWLCPTA